MNSLIHKEQLIDNLKKSFSNWKKEIKFDASFEQLDEIFFITDYILASGFVSPKINRMICGRLRDTYNSWVQQIHSWIIPTPYSMISTSESQLFDDKETELLNTILKDFMSIISLNVEVGLTKDKERECFYVDNCIATWKKHLPKLIEFSKKVQNYWQENDKR